MSKEPIQVKTVDAVTEPPSVVAAKSPRKPSATAPVRLGAKLYLEFWQPGLDLSLAGVTRSLSSTEENALRRLMEYLGETIVYLGGNDEE